jgi:hypothetical protein
MSRVSRIVACVALLVAALPWHAASGDQRPERPFAQKASWKAPATDAVREQVFAWLDKAGASDDQRAAAEALWASASMPGGDGHLIDLVCATIALVEPPAAELVKVCSEPRGKAKLPETAWLADEKTPPLVRNNLRLYYGRWLAQESLYDEAFDQLAGLKPLDVVDPAGLLFYQAVADHRLLKRDEGLAAIAMLLENEDQLPRRYASIAKLMQADLEGLKDDSLDHIARRMDDIRRRLDLGRANKKVREVEDGVIASLDKLIKEMEDQQQQQQQAAAGQQGGNQPMPLKPLEDSRPMGGKGEGKVANKPIGEKSGWGDLPPRERQEALQQLGKEFPAHYRDMIEQYFRKLATESENPDR